MKTKMIMTTALVICFVLVAWTAHVKAEGEVFDFILRVVSVVHSTMVPGDQAFIALDVELVAGTPELVTLSVPDPPPGWRAKFYYDSGYPTFHPGLKVYTSATTPLGDYVLTITGEGGGVTRSVSVTLTIHAIVISSDTLWTVAASPIIVTDNTVVLPDTTLTIEPGVAVKFDGPYFLLIYGTLKAVGAPDNPIIFTSNRPFPSPGDWTGVVFADSSRDAIFSEGNYIGGSIVRHTIVEYGGGGEAPYIVGGGAGGILIKASQPFVDHNELRYNGGWAALFFNGYGSGSPILSYNLIHDNSLGVSLQWGSPIFRNNIVRDNGQAMYIISTPTITFNTITHNGAGIEVALNRPGMRINYNNLCDDAYPCGVVMRDDARSDLDATNNWWGTTDTLVIDEHIFDRFDDPSLPWEILYEPFLTAPINIPPSVEITGSDTPSPGNTPELGAWYVLSGTVSFFIEADDPDGFVTQVSLEYSEDQIAWHEIGIDTTSPWEIQWDTTSVEDGTLAYYLRATATDNEGATEAHSHRVSVDNTPPTFEWWSMTPEDVNADTVGPVHIEVYAIDYPGEGMHDVKIRYSHDSGTTWSAWEDPIGFPYGYDIPDPGWSAYAGEYLMYQAWAMDDAGNIAFSEIITEYIDPIIHVNLAIIPIDTSDATVEHGSSYFHEIGTKLRDYLLEVSYESLHVDFEVYSKPDGSWFSVNEITAWYRDSESREEQFIEQAIDSCRTAVNFRMYDYNEPEGKGTIIFIPPSYLYTGTQPRKTGSVIYYIKEPDGRFETELDGVRVDAAIVPETTFYGYLQDIHDLAHELSHALGKLLVTSVSGQKKGDWWVLPDLYDPYGDVTGDWDLMGAGVGKERVHLSSYSKEWLDWLDYRDVKIGDWVGLKSIVSMSYRDEVPRYTFERWGTDYYIFELRTNSKEYGNWDTQTLYEKVVAIYEFDDKIIPPIPIVYEHWDTLNLARILTEPGSFDDPDLGVVFYLISLAKENAMIYIDSIPYYSLKGVSVSPSGGVLYESMSIMAVEHGTFPWPDIDLHAYGENGEHVGSNYETGEYEIQIPGAVASGDLSNAREWIFVPDSVNVVFVVSSNNNQEFLNAFPEARDLTDGDDSYIISLVYYDPNGIRYESSPLTQEIPAGELLEHSYDIVLDPDGTYTVTVEEGVPVAEADGPYTGFEGSPISLQGTASYDPDGTVLCYDWDLDGDGEHDDATGPTVTHTWGDDYSGMVGLKVTNEDGSTGTDSTTITVVNVAPSAEAGPDQMVYEGAIVSFTGSFNDPGWLDTQEIVWDFGDGETDTGSLNPTHTYSDYGVYTVTLTVTDNDGGVGADSLTVTVVPYSKVTTSSLCYFDIDRTTTDQEFKLIFTQDPTDPSTYKLTASNPGQFYYNVFYLGNPSDPVTLTIDIPSPFVTQGTIPIHVYGWVDIVDECFMPYAELSDFSIDPTQVPPDGPRRIAISGNVPSSGLIYVTIHLDYGLKKEVGFTKGINDDATKPSITITNPQSYLFEVIGIDSERIQSVNIFKRDPGFAGIVTDSSDTPVSDVKVEVIDPTGTLLATVYTDEDGFYFYHYKHKGKEAIYMIKLPDHNLEQSIPVKANRFVEVNFQIP